MIIGLTGKKGSGKDSLGLAMENVGYIPIAFAENLKEAAKLIYGLKDEQVYGDIKAKETVDERWGMTPREIMQKLGTEVARNIHPETWVRSCMMQVDDSGKEMNKVLKWVITDCRFPNEAKAIRDRGGLVVKIIRPEADTGFREEHASETEIDKINPDIVVYNDGELRNLVDAAFRIQYWIEQDVGYPLTIHAKDLSSDH